MGAVADAGATKGVLGKDSILRTNAVESVFWWLKALHLSFPAATLQSGAMSQIYQNLPPTSGKVL